MYLAVELCALSLTQAVWQFPKWCQKNQIALFNGSSFMSNFLYFVSNFCWQVHTQASSQREARFTTSQGSHKKAFPLRGRSLQRRGMRWKKRNKLIRNTELYNPPVELYSKKSWQKLFIAVSYPCWLFDRWLSSSVGSEYLTTNQGVGGSSPSWVTIAYSGRSTCFALFVCVIL